MDSNNQNSDLQDEEKEGLDKKAQVEDDIALQKSANLLTMNHLVLTTEKLVSILQDIREFKPKTENDILIQVESDMYDAVLSDMHRYEDYIKNSLGRRYCKKKILFVRHFPYYEASEQYLKYKQDLKLLFEGNPSLATGVHEQDMMLPVKKFHELKGGEDVYSAIFLSGQTVEILLDSSGKLRNKQTANELVQLFSTATLSTIDLSGVNKGDTYIDELLNAVSEVSLLIRNRIMKHDASLQVIIGNSSYAPVFALARGFNNIEIKKECSDFIQSGIACIDLNEAGKILPKKGVFVVTSLNYLECSRIFTKQNLSYCDLQNLINFLVLNASLEKLESYLIQCESLPDLQLVIMYHLLHRDIEGFFVFRRYAEKHKLQNDLLRLIFEKNNYMYKKVAFKNIYSYFSTSDIDELRTLNIDLDIQKQITTILKINRIKQRSIDSYVRNIHPCSLSDFIDSYNFSTDKNNDVLVFNEIWTFLQSKNPNKGHCMFVLGGGMEKEVFAASVASTFLYLYPDRSVRFYEGSELNTMLDAECLNTLEEDARSGSYIIIDCLNDIHHKKRILIEERISRLNCFVFTTCSSVIDDEGGKNGWEIFRFTWTDRYNFFLSRASSYEEYQDWIQEYNRLGNPLMLQKNHVAMVYFLEMLNKKIEGIEKNPKTSYELYSTAIRFTLEKYLERESIGNVSKSKTAYIKRKIDSFFNQLSELSYYKWQSKFTEQTIEDSQFDDLLNLPYIYQSKTGSIEFNCELIESFFLAHYAIMRPDLMESISGVELGLNAIDPSQNEHSTEFNFVLSYLTEKFDPSLVYESLTRELFTDLSHINLTRLLRNINYFSGLEGMDEVISYDIEKLRIFFIENKRSDLQCDFILWLTNLPHKVIVCLKFDAVYECWSNFLITLAHDIENEVVQPTTFSVQTWKELRLWIDELEGALLRGLYQLIPDSPIYAHSEISGNIPTHGSENSTPIILKDLLSLHLLLQILEPSMDFESYRNSEFFIQDRNFFLLLNGINSVRQSWLSGGKEGGSDERYNRYTCLASSKEALLRLLQADL